MKYYLITFLLGVGFGLFVSFMYCTMLTETPYSKQVTKVTKELKKEVARSEINYSKRFDSLKIQSAKLQSDLSDTRSELSKAKQKNYSLQLTIHDLIDRKPEQNKPGKVEMTDNCDSLIVTVEELMQSYSEKDSLYERTAINLEKQLRNKDSALTLKDQQYSEVRTAFEKTIASTNELIAQNKSLGKQVKRQKFKSKVLSVGLFILTATTANYLIHH